MIVSIATYERWLSIIIVWIIISIALTYYIFRLPKLSFSDLLRSEKDRCPNQTPPARYRIPPPVLWFVTIVALGTIFAIDKLKKNPETFVYFCRWASNIVVWLRDGDPTLWAAVEWAPIWITLVVFATSKVIMDGFHFLSVEILSTYAPDYLAHHSRHFLGRWRKRFDREFSAKHTGEKFSFIEVAMVGFSACIVCAFFFVQLPDSALVSGALLAACSLLVLLILRRRRSGSSERKRLEEIEKQFSPERLSIEYRRIVGRKFVKSWIVSISLLLVVASYLRFYTLDRDRIVRHDWNLEHHMPVSVIRSLEVELKPPDASQRTPPGRSPSHPTLPTLSMVIKSPSEEFEISRGGSLTLDALRILELVEFTRTHSIPLICIRNDKGLELLTNARASRAAGQSSPFLTALLEISKLCAYD